MTLFSTSKKQKIKKEMEAEKGMLHHVYDASRIADLLYV